MIVWLASYPKSGNTWIRLFLSYLLSDEKKQNINEFDNTKFKLKMDQFPIRSHFDGLTSNPNDTFEANETNPRMIPNPKIASSWAQINRGNDELEFTLKSRATELGLTQQSLARQVRQAFYGEEAQRIMRGTDEIRVMVRLPKEDRQSLHTLARLKIRTPSGSEVPLATVANFKAKKSPSFVERNDKAEIIRIGARPTDDTVDILKVASVMRPEIQKIINEQKNLSFQFTGYIAEHEELKRKNIIASITLIFALFTLLAIPSRFFFRFFSRSL